MPKIEVVLSLIVLSRNLLYPVISITSSFLLFSVHDILIILLVYHISVVCNHCKTLLLKERDTEIFIREKEYDSTTDRGLFTPADTLRKVLNAAEHFFLSKCIVFGYFNSIAFQACQEDDPCYTQKTTTNKLSHGLLEGKCHLVYVALN